MAAVQWVTGSLRVSVQSNGLYGCVVEDSQPVRIKLGAFPADSGLQWRPVDWTRSLVPRSSNEQRIGLQHKRINAPRALNRDKKRTPTRRQSRFKRIQFIRNPRSTMVSRGVERAVGFVSVVTVECVRRRRAGATATCINSGEYNAQRRCRRGIIAWFIALVSTCMCIDTKTLTWPAVNVIRRSAARLRITWMYTNPARWPGCSAMQSDYALRSL